MKNFLLIITILLSSTIFTQNIKAGPINLETKERNSSSTISLGLLGATLKPGVYYDYFITKNIELEAGLAVQIFDHSATLGVKYHLYITNNFTSFVAMNLSYIDDALVVYQLGLRYETDFGLTSTLSVGGMSKYRSELDRIENEAIAGFTIGYSF